MKITKKGKIPSERIWTGKCSTCKSEAEATQGELTNIECDRDGSQFCWMKCPVCNTGPFNGILFYPRSK